MKRVTLTQTQTNRNLRRKKKFSLIKKNDKQDSHGVSPLKDKDSGNTFSQNKDKATLLNNSFSLYSHKYHLSSLANYA